MFEVEKNDQIAYEKQSWAELMENQDNCRSVMELEKKKATGIFEINPNVCRAKAAKTQLTGRLLDRYTENSPAFTPQQAVAMQEAWYKVEHRQVSEPGSSGSTSHYHGPNESKISVFYQRHKNQEDSLEVKKAKGPAPIARPIWSAEQQTAMCYIHNL